MRCHARKMVYLCLLESRLQGSVCRLVLIVERHVHTGYNSLSRNTASHAKQPLISVNSQN